MTDSQPDMREAIHQLQLLHATTTATLAAVKENVESVKGLIAKLEGAMVSRGDLEAVKKDAADAQASADKALAMFERIAWTSGLAILGALLGMLFSQGGLPS